MVRVEPPLLDVVAFDLRIATMDPDFAPVAGEVPELLGRAAPVARCEGQPADWDGLAFDVQLETGTGLRFTLERMSLLGKKGRAEVVPLLDRTGRFRTVLNRTGRRT